MNNNLMPKEFANIGQANKREITGLSKALQDYKKEVLHLQDLPMTADCLVESINAEKLFRKCITNDLRELIEINCANCPLGFTKDECNAESCPFQSISKILNTRLKELNQILPGGINE